MGKAHKGRWAHIVLFSAYLTIQAHDLEGLEGMSQLRAGVY